MLTQVREADRNFNGGNSGMLTGNWSNGSPERCDAGWQVSDPSAGSPESSAFSRPKGHCCPLTVERRTHVGTRHALWTTPVPVGGMYLPASPRFTQQPYPLPLAQAPL